MDHSAVFSLACGVAREMQRGCIYDCALCCSGKPGGVWLSWFWCGMSPVYTLPECSITFAFLSPRTFPASHAPGSEDIPPDKRDLGDQMPRRSVPLVVGWKEKSLRGKCGHTYMTPQSFYPILLRPYPTNLFPLKKDNVPFIANPPPLTSPS